MDAQRRNVGGNAAKAVLVFALLSICSIVLAEVPPPYLHVSFDDGYGVEGKLTGVKFSVPYESIPQDRIVPGVRGKAVLFLDAVNMQHKRLIPAPEGTISVWVQPVGWKREQGGKPEGHFLQCGFNAICYLYMYIRNTYWYEGWVRPEGGRDVQMVGGVTYDIWKNGQWRMLTLVYRKGTRELYIDDYLADRKTEVIKNHKKPGTSITFAQGSKVMDELTVWDVPLSADEIAMLYYSQRPEVTRTASFCLVPDTRTRPRIDGKADTDAWAKAAEIRDWCDSFAGSAVETRDSVKLAYNGDFLYVLYREPMPEDYESAKTLHGGSVLSTQIKKNDGPVWHDDAVELRLSPDGGKTVYRLIYGASGARYDSKNADKSFTTSAWRAVARETPEYWTVEFSVPLKAFAEKPGIKRWGFNVVRYARQRGFAKRQWSYVPGSADGLGIIELSDAPVSDVRVRRRWQAGAGQLTLEAKATATKGARLDYEIAPLIHQKLRPDDEVLKKMIERKEGAVFPEKISGRKELPAPGGKVDFEEDLSYTAKKAALAKVTLTDAGGAVLYSNTSLIAAKSMIGLNIINLPTRDVMLAELTLPNKSMTGTSTTAQVTLKIKKDGGVFETKEIKSFKQIAEAAEFDVKDLPLGAIEFTAELFSKGKKIGEVKKDFYHSGKPVWWGKHVGELKSVPEPWKPIAVKNNAVELYGKTYTFENSLLPAQVNVLGDDLLSAPVRLVIVSGGKTFDTSGASITFKNGPADIRTDVRGEKADTKLTMTEEAFVEYDGYFYSTITITPKSPLKIDRVYLEAPFKKKYATLFDDSVYNMFTTLSGAIPPEGVEYEARGRIRIGSPERGIQFHPAFAKYPPEIFIVKDKNPIKIKPSGDSMVLTYTILDKPVTRAKPIKVALGIFALPVRPYDKSTRKIFHGGHPSMWPKMAKIKDKGYSMPLYWDATWTGINEGRYYHMSDKFLDGIIPSRLKNWNDYHGYSCFYTSPTVQDTTSPEYAYFQDEWRITPRQPHLDLTAYLRELKDFNGLDKTTSHKSFGQTCWATEGVTDYWMYCIDKCLRRLHDKGIRVGIYVDNTDAYGCNNPYHAHVGSTEVDSGVMMGFREWTKRLRNVIRSIDPEGHLVIHQSGSRMMSVWSMADVLVEGEQYTSNWRGYIAGRPELTDGDCYPTVLPLNRFRASYSTKLWGPVHAFLCQFWGNKPVPSRKMYRHLSGLCWVHDTPLWGEITPIDIWFKLADWGWDEKVEFIGYWNSGDLFSLDSGGMESVVASLWYRTDGKLVAIIFNDTDKPAKAKLTLNPDKFPVKLKDFTKAVDISSPDEVLEEKKKKSDVFKVQNGSVSVELRARDYRFLMFEE